jgi:hypothetical protein
LNACSGIDGPRLDKLEQRLKDEVLAEAHASDGRVHVLREELHPLVRCMCGHIFQLIYVRSQERCSGFSRGHTATGVIVSLSLLPSFRWTTFRSGCHDSAVVCRRKRARTSQRGSWRTTMSRCQVTMSCRRLASCTQACKRRATTCRMRALHPALTAAAPLVQPTFACCTWPCLAWR